MVNAQPRLNGYWVRVIVKYLDSMENGSTRTISLEDLMEIDFSSGSALRAATVGMDPVFSTNLGCGEPTSLRVLDLNADGLSDVTLTGTPEDGATTAWLLVARP